MQAVCQNLAHQLRGLVEATLGLVQTTLDRVEAAPCPEVHGHVVPGLEREGILLPEPPAPHLEDSRPQPDGTRCVGGAVQRLPVNQADGNGVLSEPDVFALPMPNVPLAPGTLNFQAWYRDPAAMMSGFNLSDGLSLLFAP